jgi:nucleotide-binding universal stress UspA family protein
MQLSDFRRYFVLRSNRRDDQLLKTAARIADLSELAGAPGEDAVAQSPGEPAARSQATAVSEVRHETAAGSRTSPPFADAFAAAGSEISHPDSDWRHVQIIEGPAALRSVESRAAGPTDLTWLRHDCREADSRRLVRKLVLYSAAPVWLVPRAAPPEIRSILVPTDFSARSAQALAFAADLARRLGIRQCATLHVSFPDWRFFVRSWDECWLDRKHEEWERFINGIDIRDIDVAPLFRTSIHTARQILEAAQSYRADLVVLTTRRRTRWSECLLPSLAAQAAASSAVPMVVLKPAPRPLSGGAAMCEALFARRDVDDVG